MSGSSVENAFSDSNIIQNDYSTAKIFIRNNRYSQATFINTTGAASAFTAGTLVARNTSTGNLVPWDNTVTTNGQSLIVGVLRDDIPSIADDGTVSNVYFCIKGDVAEGKIIFEDNTQTLDTVITAATKRVRDVLHEIGIIPIPTKELTGHDNS